LVLGNHIDLQPALPSWEITLIFKYRLPFTYVAFSGDRTKSS
jgi:hypothetical protein